MKTTAQTPQPLAGAASHPPKKVADRVAVHDPQNLRFLFFAQLRHTSDPLLITKKQKKCQKKSQAFKIGSKAKQTYYLEQKKVFFGGEA